MVAQSQAHRELEELKNRVARLEKKVGLDPEQKSKLWP
jgi:hypothetical protein